MKWSGLESLLGVAKTCMARSVHGMGDITATPSRVRGPPCGITTLKAISRWAVF